MDMTGRAVASVVLLALAMPAGAASLYKSVDSNGVISFSDLPPPQGTQATALVVPESSAVLPGASRSADVVAAAPLAEEKIRAGDEAVQASAKVDLAEHALAVARRPLWNVADPMKLGGPRVTKADQERLAYYRKDLRLAQLQLADVLRTKRKSEAQTLSAEAGAPIYGPPGAPVFRR